MMANVNSSHNRHTKKLTATSISIMEIRNIFEIPLKIAPHHAKVFTHGDFEDALQIGHIGLT